MTDRTVQVLVIEHDPLATRSLRLGDWLTAGRRRLTVCRPHAGDPIPQST